MIDASGPEFREFSDHVRDELVPRLRGSAMTVSLYTIGARTDVKFAVELGLSIMLDKPIIVVVAPGVVVPEKMIKIADEIVEATVGDENFTPRLNAAIERVLWSDQAGGGEER